MYKMRVLPQSPKSTQFQAKEAVRQRSASTKLGQKSKYSGTDSPVITPRESRKLRNKGLPTLTKVKSESNFSTVSRRDQLAIQRPFKDLTSSGYQLSGQTTSPKERTKMEKMQTGSFKKLVMTDLVESPLKEKKWVLSQHCDKNKKHEHQKDRNQKPNELSETSSESVPEAYRQQNKCPSFFKTKGTGNPTSTARKLSMKNFDVLKKLGEGKFGSVYLVRQRKTRMILAMKVFVKQKVREQGYLDQFIRQLKIQAYLDHPLIIKLYGFFHDQKRFYSLMELACHGELYDLIKDNKTLSEEGTSYIIKELLVAAQYMHKMKIFHRDIKPQNIVLIHGTIKLCDFGWAVHQKEQELRSTYCGTPLYFSPELLKGGSYDQKVDIWAIGIMAFQLRVGTSPFQIHTEKDLHKIVTEPLKLPQKGLSNRFCDFINSILKKNPQERLSCSELLKLPFISKYQNDTCEQLCLKT